MKSTSFQTELVAETENKLLNERDVFLDLAALANILQHASYCFFLLDLYLTKCGSTSLARMARIRENSCSDSSRFIMEKILLKRFGEVDLADVGKPELREEHLETEELCLQQMEIIDDWIINSVRERIETLRSNNYENWMIKKLRTIELKHMAYVHDIQAQVISELE